MHRRDGVAVAHVSAALVGFAQGAAGGVMIADGFLAAFCVDYAKSSPATCRAPPAQLPPAWLAFVALFNAAFFVGGAGGAAVGAWLTGTCGRRVSSSVSALLVAAGSLAVALAPAHAHSQLLLARVAQGAGVGGSSLWLQLWSAEARSTRDGHVQRVYVMVALALLLANVVNAAMENVADGWRYTKAVTVAPAIVVMVMSCCCMPESPRWLFKKRGREAARAALETQCMGEDVDVELEAMAEQVAQENNSAGWLGIWALRPLRRRFLIATALQVLQQTAGITVVLTYSGQLFENVANDSMLTLLIMAIVTFASALLTMRWLKSTGRRQLLLLGAACMFLGHLVSAVVAAAGCNDSGCTKPAEFAIVSSTAFAVFSFTISWGPVCWIYSTEIVPATYRVKAVSIATVLNWSAGALTVGIPVLFPFLNVNGIFFLLAALCFSGGVVVFGMCPETKGVTVEDIDLLFDTSSTHEHDAMMQSVASDEPQQTLSPILARKYNEIVTPDHQLKV